MKVELLPKDVDPIQFKSLRSANDVVSENDSVYKAEQGTLEYLFSKFSDLVMLVEEDGPERFPIFDVPTVEVEVVVLELRNEGSDQAWNLRVVALGHY